MTIGNRNEQVKLSFFKNDHVGYVGDSDVNNKVEKIVAVQIGKFHILQVATPSQDYVEHPSIDK